MDLGSSSHDYAAHRQAFLSSFFDRVPLAGDILDLSTGTGTMARGYRLPVSEWTCYKATRAISCEGTLVSQLRTVRVSASVCLALAVLGYPSRAEVNGSGYVPGDFRLAFHDEFDGTELDRSTWYTRYIYAGGTLDRLNDEQQVYRDNNNHIVSDGTLKLFAYKVREDPSGINYESGMIRSHYTRKYGYFEARVRMPGGRGVFPAFWLNPEDQTWPPEYDIFEFVNNEVEDRINMLHTGVINHGAQGGAFLYVDPNFHTDWTYWLASFNFPDDFHVIAGLWDTDDTVTTFVDGVPIVTRSYNWVHDDGSDGGVAHILVNLAIGGPSWAGRHGIDDCAFPQALEVDYVRVYCRADVPDCQPIE